MLRLIAFLTFISLSGALHATLRYQSGVDEALWTVNSSPIQCEMVHPISHYGSGRFVYSSGGELAFQLTVMRAAPKDSVASLYSVAPFWREDRDKDLAQLTISKGTVPVYVGGSLAVRMLYELEEGYHPTLHYKDWADYTDDVFVTISSVNFHRVYDEFQACISQALPYGPDQIKDATVYFDTDRHNISEIQRQQLREIVLFGRVDKGMQIEINGHADARGRRIYNKKLSERRSREVQKYLVAEGVASEQISLRSFGESKPVDNNRTERGRSNNRRVNVIIRHE